MQKDLCLKRYLSDKRRFADLINGVVAGGRELIAAESVSRLGSQSESTRTQKYRDRLYKAALGVNFMIIGLEGQEKTHYLMPLRCMSYDATEYERQAAGIRRKLKDRPSITEEERLSGFGADDRLRPCVILVLFFGKQWDGAKTLHELLDFAEIPEELRALVSDYGIHVLEVRKLEDTSMFCTDVKQVFDAIRYSEDRDKFRELIFSDPAYRELDIEAYEMIAQYARATELRRVLKQSRKGDTVDMCEAIRLMMLDEKREGKREGKRVGRLEGKAGSVIDILKERGPVPAALRKRIRTEKNLDVLTKWVILAAKSETVEEFERAM
ncbi:MAG: transposase [Lachnospiraceae bacterium]|nr:transposase [Lachnospiraceae bacterium]